MARLRPPRRTVDRHLGIFPLPELTINEKRCDSRHHDCREGRRCGVSQRHQEAFLGKTSHPPRDGECKAGRNRKRPQKVPGERTCELDGNGQRQGQGIGDYVQGAALRQWLGIERPTPLGITSQCGANRFKTLERRPAGADGIEHVGEVQDQLALTSNPCHRETRGARKIETRIGEGRLPYLDDMLAPKLMQRRVSAAVDMGENRAQIGAECVAEPVKQFVNDTIRREFEHQVAAITRRGLEHVQAREMNRREVVERCSEPRNCRVTKRLDRCPKCRNMLGRDVGNNGDEGVAHGRPARNETINSSINGPSYRGRSTCKIPRLRTRRTSSGNCTSLTARPQQG